MRNAESVKARLKNMAESSGKTMQDLLTAYGLERTVHRISISPYAERFTLKGGIFLYALFKGNYPRATVDIDLLASGLSSNEKEIAAVFKDIFTIKCDDPLTFDLNSLDTRNIAEFKKYPGVRISVTGYLDRTRIPMTIDIGFGDRIYPERTRMDFPAMLDEEPSQIYAYSIYSIIAEKFEAMVSLGLANSRYKDYYDICVLALSHDLSGKDLKEAIAETFAQRRTRFSDIAAFETGFPEDATRQTQWKAFLKKKKPMLNFSFLEAVSLVRQLIQPIVEAISEERDFDLFWNKGALSWQFAEPKFD